MLFWENSSFDQFLNCFHFSFYYKIIIIFCLSRDFDKNIKFVPNKQN